MDYAAVTSLIIFLTTLLLMVRRPRGMNLGFAAGIGAIASLLLGTVTLTDAATAFGNIWNAALAFVGIVTLSVTLDAMGFFKWAALRIARLARGSGVRLYLYVSLPTAAVSILFANDSAVLILTPLVMEMVRHLKMNKDSGLSYLFAAGLMADTAAMPLLTSNPVNIVSADFFGYTFIEHMIFMTLITVTTIVLTLVVVYLFFRKKIPKSYSPQLVETLIKQEGKPMWLKTSIGTLIAIDVGYVMASFNGVPVSFIICAGAFFLLVLYAVTYRREPVFENEQMGAKYVLRKVN